jgi:hypothetical protein
MKNKIYQITKMFGLLLLLPIFACQNSSNSNTTDKKDSTKIANADSSAQSDITNPELEKAKKDGNTVFLVITGNEKTDIDKALKIANDTKAKVKNSTVVQINRDDKNNSVIVKKLGISSVSVPFFLVISQHGLPFGGFELNEVNSDSLIKSIPTPRMDEASLALTEERPVFIVVSKKGFNDKTTIIENCNKANASFKIKAAIIEVDFDDPKEKVFLSQLDVKSLKGKTITVVCNPTGKITETYTGVQSMEKLKAAAIKVKKCAPGECSPGGC